MTHVPVWRPASSEVYKVSSRLGYRKEKFPNEHQFTGREKKTPITQAKQKKHIFPFLWWGNWECLFQHNPCVCWTEREKEEWVLAACWLRTGGVPGIYPLNPTWLTCGIPGWGRNMESLNQALVHQTIGTSGRKSWCQRRMRWISLSHGR